MQQLNSLPFYDPTKSYEDNYSQGPFGGFQISNDKIPLVTTITKQNFLGHEVNLPFGIPAGPLLNSRFITAAFQNGFDLCVYKTVRSRLYKSHPLPNILSVHLKQDIKIGANNIVLADNHFTAPLSITNSFGVPSFSPDEWQLDMAKAVTSAGKGNLLIGSFQGTLGKEPIEKDYALTARLVAETHAPVLEANLSCPNEGSKNLLCFDIDKTERIVHAIKEQVPDKPLILKLAFFADHNQLSLFVKRIGKLVDGFSAINTLSAVIVDHQGNPALPGRPEGGVCGDAIRWAGLEMVEQLAVLRNELDYFFIIIGVGGVNSVENYQQYRMAGADAVMSATGAMWNTNLAMDIKLNLN